MSIERAIHLVLENKGGGLTLGDLEASLAQRGVSFSPGVVESILLLSDEFFERTERWFRKTDSTFDNIASAIRRHADESGRRIFKAETALQGVPDSLKPTRDELARILLDMGDFELLRNDMIQRKD